MSEGLYYRSWGEPRRQALILVHPLGADGAFWDEAAALLSRSHYLVACDLRSAGRSPAAGRPMTVEAHAADLEALVTKLSVDSIVPVGCAIGSIVAAGFAARTNVPVKALILSNPAIGFSEPAREMITRRVGIARADGLGGLVDEIVGRAFEGMPDDARRARFKEQLARQSGQDYADSAEGARDADIADDLRGLTCPALLLTSLHDVLLPPQLAKDVHRLMPHAELRHIDEGAHFIPYQAPAAFAAAVEDFLSAAARHGG